MRPKLNFHFPLLIKDAKEVPSKMEVAPHCTPKAKGGEKIGLDFKNFIFGFQQLLESFQEIVCSRAFSRKITSRSWPRWSFIPHFTSQKSETDFYFTSSFSSLQYPLSQDTEVYGRCEVNFSQTSLVQCHKVSLRSHFFSSSILVFWFVNSATSASFHTCHHQVNPISFFFGNVAFTSGIVMSSSFVPLPQV